MTLIEPTSNHLPAEKIYLSLCLFLNNCFMSKIMPWSLIDWPPKKMYSLESMLCWYCMSPFTDKLLMDGFAMWEITAKTILKSYWQTNNYYCHNLLLQSLMCKVNNVAMYCRSLSPVVLVSILQLPSTKQIAFWYDCKSHLSFFQFHITFSNTQQ